MNKQIIGAVVIIGASGVIAAWVGKKPITKVILGSYILLFVLSLMDLFGGGISRLGSALAMIAVLYVLLNEFPWQTLIGALQGKATAAVSATKTKQPATQVTLNAPSKLA